MSRLLILGVFLLYSVGLISAQSNDKNFSGADIPSAFMQIDNQPNHLFFENPDFKIYNRNGHLQGIQHYKNESGTYLILSGSSDSVAYYVMVDLKLNKVVRYNQIGFSPYDHAGGFQVIGDFLVLGLEDNSAKDASNIVFYDISNPGKSDQKPTYTLLRGKTFKTKTAGALGITYYKGKHLMAVISWDAATIDFYSSNGKPMYEKGFEMDLTYTWLPNVENKQDWINPRWGSYQGVSFYTGVDSKLYLFGFSRNNWRNEIDLFSVAELDNKYLLKKIATRSFDAGKNSFRYGTGIWISDEGKIYMYCTPYNLHKKNYVNVYKSSL